MGRVKEAAAEDLTAVGAAVALPAPATPAGRAESSGAKTSLSRRARLPGPARFALVIILSFALSSLGQSFLAYWTRNELASIARPTDSRTEAAVLAAWRLFGLALGWFGDYDGYDLAALALLSHGPTTLLVSVFYDIRALTAGAYLGVDIVSAFLPFLLLRRLSGAHSAAPDVTNREIVVDRGIQLLTSLQAALVYGVTLFLASRSFLPDALVLYFDGIPTIRPAADATLFGFGHATSQVLSLLFGLAARAFIFTPLVTTGRTQQDQKNAEFDPVNATLGQTVAWNLWGYTTQTKVSVRRTAVAMLFTAVGTFLNTSMVIKGVEPYGAAVYASIWVIAALVTGLSLRYVGSA
ncbi:hypothetical protein MFIFM68171_10833 [Madurella fahalii]|uniref:Uncharacterized protein n=1 Tax=Madurella fahalii TaxID=1157608 RepID=A0ABQ0GSB4_9PEZI